MTETNSTEQTNAEIRPFRIDIPQADLDDLRRPARADPLGQRAPARLWRPADGPGPAGLGVRGSGRLREGPGGPLAAPATTGVAGRPSLNGYPQFTTMIDGQTIHFLHMRSPEPDATPLILTHGWPNTFLEYVDLVGPLTDPRAHGGDPADAFHVVVPSLPGFAFSGPTAEAGWDALRTAQAWAELMRRLGYDRYGAHGNDAGSIVAPLQGRVDPEHVLGVHVTQIFSFPSGDPAEFEGLTQEELQYLGFLQGFVDHAVHDKLQSAQPQTVAHALADSPAGQIAWSGQLFGNALSQDHIITNVAIYWLTNTAASAGRFYYENKHADHPTEPTTVPMGLASFAFDFRPIRRFAERDHANIVSWSEFDRGSHWATHDAPDLLLGDLRQFFRTSGVASALDLTGDCA